MKAPEGPPPDLSLVIPVYNEAENLRPLVQEIVEALAPLGKTYEVILVDDGSTDGSGAIIDELAQQDGRVRGVHFLRNYGQTAAFDAGFRTARGEVIVTMDADLQYDPRDIPLLLAKLAEYDTVCGFRLRRADPWIKRLSSVIANTVRNWLSEERIRDVGCSLKAFKRPCVEKLKLYDGMHRFFPTLVKMEGYSVVEVPVSHRPRLHGQSKYNIRNRLFKSFLDLLAVRWMKRRRLTYQIREEG